MGGRYCPTVRMSQPVSAMSRSVSSSCSIVSPRPTMMPHFTLMSTPCCSRYNTEFSRILSVFSYTATGRTRRYRCDAVSMLCARHTGRASRTTSKSSRRPLKSGISTSTMHSGVRRRTASITCAKWPAPSSGQIVAVDRRDDGVLQAQLLDGLCHVLGLERVDRARGALGHRAETAVARAHVAQDHEGRGTLAPALVDVGAARFLAHRVEVQARHQMIDELVLVVGVETNLEPLGALRTILYRL